MLLESSRISDEKNVIEITNLNCGLRKRLRFPFVQTRFWERFNGQKLSFRLDLTLETVTVLTVRTSYQEAGKVGGGTRLTWIREIKAARTIGERVSFCNRVVAQPLFAIKPRYASPILGWASGWALYPAERKYDSGSPRFPSLRSQPDLFIYPLPNNGQSILGNVAALT